MDVIIKSFLGMFLTMWMVFLGLSLSTVSMTARSADSFAADCVRKIECSDFAVGVIDACKADAQAQSYDLEVQLYQPTGSARTRYGRLTLAYESRIPLLGICRERYVYADLR